MSDRVSIGLKTEIDTLQFLNRTEVPGICSNPDVIMSSWQASFVVTIFGVVYFNFGSVCVKLTVSIEYGFESKVGVMITGAFISMVSRIDSALE